MASLLEISDELTAFSEMIDELPGGEIPQELAAIIDTWFAELGEARDKKLDGYAALIRQLELRASIRRGEAERMLNLAVPEENKARRLRERLKLFMQTHGEKRIDTARFRISLRGNGGVQPLEIDEARLSPNYIDEKVIQVPNKEAIRKAIESGIEVAGAALLPRGTNLQIQ